MKIINRNTGLDFTNGWTLNKLLKGGGDGQDPSEVNYGFTLNKLLKGAGVGSAPSEISGWEVLSDLTLAEALDYVDFTGLDINTDKAYHLLLSLINGGGSNGSFTLNINGVATATNYYTQTLYGSTTSVGASRANNPAFIYIDNGDSELSIITVVKDVNGYLRCFLMNNRGDPTANRLENRIINGTFVAANITSIKIIGHTTDALGVGSRLLLAKPRCG